MGLRQWIGKKIAGKPGRVNHDFDAEDRKNSAEVRRLKMEMRKMEFQKEKLQHLLEIEATKAELRELRADLYPDAKDGDDNEDMLLGLVKNLIINKPELFTNIAGARPQATTTPESGVAVSQSDQIDSNSGLAPQEVQDIFVTWAKDNKISLKAQADLKKRLGV